MQAVEIVIFFMISIIVGSLIILFITGLDAGGIFDGVHKMIFPQDFDQNYTKVSRAKFNDYVYSCWQKCEYGEIFLNCGTVYITDGTELSSESLKEGFQKYNFCTDCNVEVPNEIALPAVVQVSCEENKIIVKG